MSRVLFDLQRINRAVYAGRKSIKLESLADLASTTVVEAIVNLNRGDMFVAQRALISLATQSRVMYASQQLNKPSVSETGGKPH